MKVYKNVNIVTCDSDFHVYLEGLLVTDGDVIAYVGAYEDTWEKQAQEVVDMEGAWMMPGLVNTHTHSAMTLLRGISDDENLHEWLEKTIWPAESRFTPEVTTSAVQLALYEMLQTGTTTFNDMYNPSGVDIKQIYEVVKVSGMRCYFSPTMFSTPRETTAATLERTRKIIEEIQSFNDERFRVMVAPHAPYTCEEDLLLGSLELAKELELPIHIHVAETEEENKIMLNRTGLRPLDYLKSLGYLEQRGIFAHSLELIPSEISLLAESSVSVAHNPISNLKLASGIAPIVELMDAGVRVGFATDSVASNNNLDLFEEARTAAFLQKMKYKDARQFPVEMVLRTMTLGGAETLGMEDQIGSLEVGKQADFIIIDPRTKAHLYPMNRMLSHLVYAIKGGDVDQVYIAGKQVVKDGQVLTIHQEKLFQQITELGVIE
ncbi:S-adenosylhomocysteine deaminase / Methylthioadenosine deaminase [Streptococcus sp. DD10]|uniref:TRZ/ATZ family protein n=1 Tax=Streptococcus sp. DD10 TaxID=1777878 RepID=UPI00079AE56D|nr:TRZ/ATZ family protein [Streptococcus sp. DD10]KXT74681.1 S-adenosylhomocysteine deaminase / Methylthioadenosine deaminase [Streptococcus sp. DD10]